MKIKKYKNDLYPYDVWVAKDADIDQLIDMFTFLYADDTAVSEEETREMLDDKSSLATTYKVTYKSNGNAGSLIIIYEKEIDVNTIAHESGHVTQDIAEFLGFDFVSKGTNEHIMYLLGWVAGCVDNFIKSK